MRRKILRNVFMDFLLEIDAYSPIASNNFAGTDPGVGGNITARIGNADVGGNIANRVVSPLNGSGNQPGGEIPDDSQGQPVSLAKWPWTQQSPQSCIRPAISGKSTSPAFGDCIPEYSRGRGHPVCARASARRQAA